MCNFLFIIGSGLDYGRAGGVVNNKNSVIR